MSARSSASRSSGDLHLYRRTDSPYWYYWTLDDSGKKRYVATKMLVSEVTRDVALRRLAEKQREELSGVKTLAWVRDVILPRIEQSGIRPGTHKEYRITMQHLIEIFGEGAPLDSFGKESSAVIKAELLDGRSPHTVNKQLRNARHIFEYVVDAEALPANPFRRVKMLRTSRKPRSLTPEQVDAFFRALEVEPDIVRHLLPIYLYEGMRRSELLAVKRTDIDPVTWRMVLVNIKHRDKKERSILLNEQSIPHVQWFMQRHFSQYPFAQVKPDQVTHWAKRVLRRAGLDSYHLHDFRHTFATLAIRQGARVRDVQRHVGHTSVTTTEGYMHEDSYEESCVSAFGGTVNATVNKIAVND